MRLLMVTYPTSVNYSDRDRSLGAATKEWAYRNDNRENVMSLSFHVAHDDSKF